MTSTKDETLKSSPELEETRDLEGFAPSPPAHRIDEKAATLEDEIQDLKIKFNRERFTYVFILTVFFVLLIGPHLTNGLLAFLITAALIFTISVGKYLDFPWAVVPLERWHDLWYRACEKKLLGAGSKRETEPIENGDDES